MSNPAYALVALHVAVALFGLSGLFGPWLALSPITIVLGRTVVAALVLAIVARLWAQPMRGLRGFLGNGAILAIHWVAFFTSIQAAGVAIGLLGYASFPLFVLLLERALLGRRWNGGDAAIAAMVCAGLVMLVPQWSWEDRTTRGLALGLVAGFTFALLAVRNRGSAAQASPVAIALGQNAGAALCLLPVALLWPGAAQWPGAEEIVLLILLGVFCTALAHTLFIASLKGVTAHTASVVAALEPVYGIAFAVLLLDERPALRTWIAAALLVGAAIAASQRARPVRP